MSDGKRNADHEGQQAAPVTRGQDQFGKVMCLACPARDSFLCSGFEDDELRHLAARATRFALPKGRTLILEGDPSHDVYNVIEGDVMLSRVAPDGRRQILGFLGQGDFIGLTLAPEYRFTAEALSDSRLCRFDRRAIEELMERFPAVARQVQRMGAAMVDHLLEMIFALGRKTAAERVASFLYYQAERQGCCLDPAKELKLPMTRAEMADYLGLTIETVSRSITRLRKEGIIETGGMGRMRIHDLDALRQRADMADVA